MAIAWITAARAQALPGGFAFMRDIDPSILQDIRYAGSNNSWAGRSPAMTRPNVW